MTTHTDTVLDTILASTRAAVAASKAHTAAAELERRAAQHRPRGWAAALRRRAATGTAVIAEIKKASPSKGLIRADFDAAWLARRYRAGGAAALSVLTDEPYFQGSLRNLEMASDAAPLPCLRKDFIVDEYQIAESRAHRADAILLIAAALTADELKQFAGAARSFALDVLVEVHTAAELDRVLDTGIAALGGTGAPADRSSSAGWETGAPADRSSSAGWETGALAIGVNNRDLRTFDVSLETALALVERIPSGVVRVAESGISTGEDIARLRAAGFDAFLVGESLMRQADPGQALAEMLANAAAAGLDPGKRPEMR